MAEAGRLLVFTRYPEPGRAKTRLIPALGAAGAAALQRAMTERTLARVGAGGAWSVEVRHEGGDTKRAQQWLGARRRCVPQGEGDLGARLRRAFAECFAQGCPAVVVVGADCPDAGEGDVADAFAALARAPAVFGPAADGGYWLLGLRRGAWPAAAQALFAGIPWGSAGVLAASERAAAAAGLETARLRTLADVDLPGDLAEWELALREDAAGARLSVVVPTLGEADHIAALVDGLRADGRPEVVVADGASADGTAAIAAARGARVTQAPRGRAAQLNAGAAAATGELLLFLHADTRLPPGWRARVRGTLADPGTAAGAFSFATDSTRRSLRAIERLANWRGRRLGILFGDQGLFVRRADFLAAGGFPDQPLLEDYELVRRLRRRGRVAILPEAAVTSARRWERRGAWRTSLRNVAITAAYHAGIPPRVLAGWYRPRRAP